MEKYIVEFGYIEEVEEGIADIHFKTLEEAQKFFNKKALELIECMYAKLYTIENRKPITIDYYKVQTTLYDFGLNYNDVEQMEIIKNYLSKFTIIKIKNFEIEKTAPSIFVYRTIQYLADFYVTQQLRSYREKPEFVDSDLFKLILDDLPLNSYNDKNKFINDMYKYILDNITGEQE